MGVFDRANPRSKLSTDAVLGVGTLCLASALMAAAAVHWLSANR